MRRRKFISLVGGAAASWPFAVRAQQPGRLPTIGFLGPDASDWRSWTDAFVVRLRELGWVERRTIAIEYRWSKARPERVADIAAEFVRLKVDVIVTHGGAVNTLKEATAVIPIVFAIAGDPVGSGFVANLAHPGGNVTGMSLEQNDIASKRLELLRGVVPNLRRLAMLFNAHYPSSVRETDEVQAAARTLRLEVAPHEIRRGEDIAPVFELLSPKRMHFTSWKTLSFSPTERQSLRLRSVRGYRRSSVTAILSKPARSCPMDQTSRPCSGAPPRWSIKSCAEPSLAIFRSSSRPNSRASSISQPPRRWVSLYRITYSCSPTR